MSSSNLTTDPRYETFYKAVKGDKNAEKLVIEQFHPLVTKLANKYRFLPEVDMYDDLIQAGRIGVWQSIQTFDLSYRKEDGNPPSPMTWIYSKVRGSVQSLARPNKPDKKFPRSIAFPHDGDSSGSPSEIENLPDYQLTNEVKETALLPTAEDLLMAGCGSLDSKAAQIIKMRFGLMGETPMRPIDIANKMGLSKQQVNGYMSKFYKQVRSKHPNLHKVLSNSDGNA